MPYGLLFFAYLENELFCPSMLYVAYLHLHD
jgi:hypothetical protein